MSKITAIKRSSEIQINANHEQSLMKQLVDAGLPVASSCGGDGICAKCRISILNGAEQLSPPSDTEQFTSEKFKLQKNERLACQVKVLGDCQVSCPYW